MANVCQYKMIVKGKKNACYAFYAGQNHFWQDVEDKDGTYENYELYFSGECKWSVDQYCAAEETVQGRSRAYSVEVMCNSRDVDDDPKTAFYKHYKNGVPVTSEVPEELVFEDVTNQNNETYADGMETFLREKFIRDNSIVTEKGNSFRIEENENRVYMNDVFSIAIPSYEFNLRSGKENNSQGEESETFIETPLLFAPDDDEAVIMKLQFSNDSIEPTDEKMITFLDGDYQIHCNWITKEFNLWKFLTGESEKINIITEVIIKSVSYYITVTTAVYSESSVATAVRLLEDALNSIVICENNEKIQVERVRSNIIHNISNFILGNNSDDDNSEDYDDE